MISFLQIILVLDVVNMVIVEPSGVQALKNPNPFEGC